MNIVTNIIDRHCHIGMTHRECVREVISHFREGMKTFREQPPEVRRDLIKLTIRHHEHNRQAYQYVMGGQSNRAAMREEGVKDA